MNQKLTGTGLWLQDHPHDAPPRDPKAARRWRRRRGIGGTTWQQEMRKKYDAVMEEKRSVTLAETFENSNPETT